MGSEGNENLDVTIINPTFTGDFGWVKGADWTLPGTFARFQATQVFSSVLFQITSGFKANNTFIIEFDLANVNIFLPAGGMRVVLGVQSSGIRYRTNGHKKEVISTAAEAFQLGFTLSPSTIGDRLDLDNIIVRIPSGEVITTLEINWPDVKRFEYSKGTVIDNIATLASRNGKTNCLVGYND